MTLKSSNKNAHGETNFLKTMLDSLITSKTRIKLLIKFFLNSNTTAYLRNLASEFGESTNGLRQELNHLEEANLLQSELIQNKKIYRANLKHPYYQDIHLLLLKYVGIDQIVDELVKRVGNLEQAFITNDFAQGKPGKTIDLVLVGNNFDETYLKQLVQVTEKHVSFKINYTTVSTVEMPQFVSDLTKSLLIWTAE